MRILLLEDNPADAELIEYELREALSDFILIRVETEEDFLKELLESPLDLILSDYDLPQYNGALALAEAKKSCPDVPFILVTGAVSEDRAIEILTSGAQDYVLKNRLQQRLVPAVQRALTEAEQRQGRKKAEEELREAHRTLEERVKLRTAELEAEIVARTKMEEALRESEERYRELVENANSIIMRMDLFGKITFFNEYAQNFFGYSLGEIMGANARILVPQGESINERNLEEMVDTLLKNPDAFMKNENENMRKNGERVWISWRNKSIRDSSGNTVGTLSIGQDITERKWAEEARNRQVAFENIVLEILARFASCAAAEVDNEITAGLKEIGLFLGVENVFVILVSRESATWSSIYNWAAPGFPSFGKKYQNVPIGTNPWSEKILLQTEAIQINSLDDLPPEAESERREYESENVKSLLLVPLRGRGIRVIGSAGFRSYSRQIQWSEEDIRSLRLFSDTIANVLERKRAENALRREQDFVSRVMEIAGALVIVLDREGHIVRFNRACEIVTGYTFQEVKGKFWNFLIPPEELKEVTKRWKEITGRTLPGKNENAWLNKDGTRSLIAWNNTVLTSETGEVQYVIGTGLDITERKRVEESLRESEEKFRAAFDHSPVPMSMTALDGRMMSVNAAFARMLGYSESELTGMKFWDLTHPDDIAENEAGMAPVVRGETRSFRMEKRYIRKDGRIIWADMSTSSVFDARGNPLFIITHAQDITERKRAEEKLRESTEQLKKSQEIAHLGSWELDLASNRLSWSDEVYRIFGIEPQKFPATYEAFLEAVHPDDREVVDAAYTQSLSKKRDGYEIDHRVVRHSDGEIRIVHEKCQHIFDDTGRIARSIGMVHDITERRRAEEELHLKNFAFDASLAANCVAGLDFTIAQTNTAFLRNFGYQSKDEVIGRPIYDFFQNEEDAVSVITALNRTGQWEGSSMAKKRDGSTFFAQGLATAIKDANGEIVGYQSSILDISERKRSEDEIKKSVELLASTNKELESFSYSVSHDLQAPLRAIKGFCKMILEDKERGLDVETKQKFAVIQENTEKMQRLIDDLLTLSRVGRQGISLNPIDMNALVKNAWKELKMVYPEKPLALKMKDLQPACGDQALIGQVFANLLSNAIKFSANRKRIVVEVGSYQKEGGNVYYVKDKGVGFDMKYYDKLFGAFQRLHNASAFQGTGIGLSIAQRIVHLHGGQIWAEGEVGEGATFYFLLPRESKTLSR